MPEGSGNYYKRPALSLKLGAYVLVRKVETFEQPQFNIPKNCQGEGVLGTPPWPV